MMFAGTILLLLSLALLFIIFIAEDDRVMDTTARFMIAGTWAVGIIGTMITVTASYESTPKAIEVYQGKTTLEITYRDSIPIDSVVVYKKN